MVDDVFFFTKSVEQRWEKKRIKAVLYSRDYVVFLINNCEQVDLQ